HSMRIDPIPVNSLASVDLSPRVFTDHDYQELAEAMRSGQMDTVPRLVSEGMRIDRPGWGNPEVAAIEEALDQHFDIIRYLLKEGALAVNGVCCWQDNRGLHVESLITLAMHCNASDKFQELITCLGADPSARLHQPFWSWFNGPGNPWYEDFNYAPNAWQTPLELALRRDNAPFFTALIEAGASLKKDDGFKSCLQLAIERGKHSASPNDEGKNDFVTWLLKLGADPSDEGAIREAVRQGRTDILELLRQHGACFSFREPLRLALFQHSKPTRDECLEFLIQNGAGEAASLRNQKGETLLQELLDRPTATLIKCIELGVYNTPEEINTMIMRIQEMQQYATWHLRRQLEHGHERGEKWAQECTSIRDRRISELEFNIEVLQSHLNPRAKSAATDA
ncbi:MAG: hypothetical protein KDK78_11180, partial [Chlamydiia bacterium]|nr:hypothetical protein [Chlamydiia bacterium]